MVDPDKAVWLALSAGLLLDDWQEELLRRSLESNGEQWTHFEVGCIAPRQNGKNVVIEARELAGLFLDDECELIIHSAHEFATSLEASRRLLYLIESTPELDRQVARVSRSHGDEGIELDDGSRIRFRTRTKGGGRGFSSDLLVLDEAMELPESAYGALLPTLSARPNPQIWYTGSAVDQTIHPHGVRQAWERTRTPTQPSFRNTLTRMLPQRRACRAGSTSTLMCPGSLGATEPDGFLFGDLHSHRRDDLAHLDSRGPRLNSPT